MTEAEIAQELNVDQSTISRDVKALKELSQQFIYDLAKSDLAYYYKQSIDGIEEAKREAWRIYNDNNISAKGQAEHASEFALSEALRDIIAQEQDREIDLKDALGLR